MIAYLDLLLWQLDLKSDLNKNVIINELWFLENLQRFHYLVHVWTGQKCLFLDLENCQGDSIQNLELLIQEAVEKSNDQSEGKDICVKSHEPRGRIQHRNDLVEVLSLNTLFN